MILWRPLTCGCEIETDDQDNWKSTLFKCDLHREFTGKSLLREVREHNRENSPKGEPDTIEGILGFDFEPDWIKKVKKYPSIEKLEETQFNLDMMRKYSPVDKEFQYCLSNFLNSSTSVLWYLLEEYSRKFGFEIDKYRKDAKYRGSHVGLVSSEAGNFLSWYDSEFNALQKDKVGFLLNKRHDNIHQAYTVLVFKVEQPFKLKGGLQGDLPIDWSKMNAYFQENNNTKAMDLCSHLIDKLKSLVDQAHIKFPF